MRIQSLAAAAALAIPLSAGAAHVQIIGTLSNFDVFNRTGQFVNDFKITIVGGNAGMVRGTYNNPLYGPGVVMPMPGNVMIKWGPNGNFVPPGGIQHFGVSYFGNPIQAGTVCFDWTLNGQVVPTGGDPNRPQQIWNQRLNRVVDVIRNTTWRVPRRTWVQRFGLVLNREVQLEELVGGSPIFSNSFPIDSQPVSMEPETDLVFDDSRFDTDESGAVRSFIIGYRSFEDNNGSPGEELGDTFNAAVVPTPAGAVLLGLSGMAFARRRRA